MAGLLDMMDPRTAGLLSGAFAGLNASGPSAMPVSLGQVIGRAGAAGMGAYQDATAQQLAQRRAEQLMKMQEQQMGMMGIQQQLAQQNAQRQAETLARETARREAVGGILGKIGTLRSGAPTVENAANPQYYTGDDALEELRKNNYLDDAEKLVKAMPKMDVIGTGGGSLIGNLRTMKPGTFIQNSVSPDTQARLNWDRFQFDNLSRNQSEGLRREDARIRNEGTRIGMEGARLYDETGLRPFSGGAGVGGVPSGGFPMGAAPRSPVAPQTAPGMAADGAPLPVGSQPSALGLAPKQQRDINKANAIKVAEAARDLPSAVTKAEEAISQIDEMIGTAGMMVGKDKVRKPHPGFSDYVGAGVPYLSAVDGTDAADFRKRLEQVKGGAFLQAFQSLKGGGQITEVEGKKATDAITRMDKAQSEAEFVKAAREYQRSIRKLVDIARNASKGDFTPLPSDSEWAVVR